MKIAIILGAFSVGTRPLDTSNILDNPRGLTGTDLCFIRTAEELAKLGNTVYAFTVRTDTTAIWNNVMYYNFDQRFDVVDDSFDCIISINEPNILFGMARKPKRIVWQMLNDFSFIQPGFDDEVDLYLGVCEAHTKHMSKQTPKPEKWNTLSLGCDIDNYTDNRIPGRVIWCSSADRGLHWLLSEWSKIKKEVNFASLRVFYHFNYIGIEEVEEGSKSHPHIIEMAQRIRYIKNAMKELKHLDVKHVGSVSRNRMKNEFSKASVFGFPCDTVAFSEGFSVSSLEAHASYTVPVMTSVDCLGSIYNNSGCVMIQAPVSERLNEFSDAVIKSLTDDKFANDTIEKCREFASKHTWKQSAEKLLEFIK